VLALEEWGFGKIREFIVLLNSDIKRCVFEGILPLFRFLVIFLLLLLIYIINNI